MVFGPAQCHTAFEAVRRLAVNDLGDTGRADKADRFDIRMRTNAFDYLFAAVNYVKYTIGQAGLLQQLRHSPDRKRYKFGRLHYHRVAEDECVGHRPIWHHQWKIERHDRRDYANWEMFCSTFYAFAYFEDLARHELWHRARKLGQLNTLFHLGLCLVIGLAIFFGDKRR